MLPPYRVLASVGRSKKLHWLIWREVLSAFVDEMGATYRAIRVRPVDHERNDPEAIAIINQARNSREKSFSSILR